MVKQEKGTRLAFAAAQQATTLANHTTMYKECNIEQHPDNLPITLVHDHRYVVPLVEGRDGAILQNHAVIVVIHGPTHDVADAAAWKHPKFHGELFRQYKGATGNKVIVNRSTTEVPPHSAHNRRASGLN